LAVQKIDMQIRRAVEADVPNLLPLMRELAEFEKYADGFAITEEVLHEQGFRRSPPDFIKELYVTDKHRSKGVGKLLMKAIATEAEKAGCAMIKWWVAKWNHRSIQFYERLGAQIDPDWHEFQMSEKSFRDLAAS
jgi:GNAT superfamily N-acetyltransferase